MKSQEISINSTIAESNFRSRLLSDTAIKNPEEVILWVKRNGYKFDDSSISFYKHLHPSESKVETINRPEQIKRNAPTFIKKGDIKPASDATPLLELGNLDAVLNFIENNPQDPRVIQWKKENNWK
jgi:hypothetical protein